MSFRVHPSLAGLGEKDANWNRSGLDRNRRLAVAHGHGEEEDPGRNDSSASQHGSHQQLESPFGHPVLGVVDNSSRSVTQHQTSFLVSTELGGVRVRPGGVGPQQALVALSELLEQVAEICRRSLVDVLLFGLYGANQGIRVDGVDTWLFRLRPFYRLDELAERLVAPRKQQRRLPERMHPTAARAAAVAPAAR